MLPVNRSTVAAILLLPLTCAAGSTNRLTGSSTFRAASGSAQLVPVLRAIQPTVVVAGSRGVILRAEASDLAAGATVKWNGADRPTREEIPAYSLEAEIPASDVAVPGVAEVTIQNPGPSGGISNPLTVVILSPGTLYVDDDAPADPGPGDPDVSDPLEDGSREHPFDSIQEAVDVARQQDTVEVGPGLYTEDLVIRAPGCAIRGSGIERTTLESVSGLLVDAGQTSGLAGLLNLSLSGMTARGGTLRAEWFESFALEDVSLQGASLDLDLRSTEVNGESKASFLALRNMQISGGQIRMLGIAGIHPKISIESVVAPAATVDLRLIDPSVSADVAIRDSTLGGLKAVASGSNWRLHVSSTQFTGAGIDLVLDTDARQQVSLSRRRSKLAASPSITQVVAVAARERA